MNWSEVFEYNPDTGTLIWKKRTSGSAVDRRFNTKTSGKVAGDQAQMDKYCAYLNAIREKAGKSVPVC